MVEVHFSRIFRFILALLHPTNNNRTPISTHQPWDLSPLSMMEETQPTHTLAIIHSVET
jgi:hypothetical protein